MLNALLTLALALLLSVTAKRVHPAGDQNWCIHAEAVVPRSGTQLGIERCSGSFRQEWNYFGSSSILQLRGTNLCAAPASKQNGARVYLRKCPSNSANWGESSWHPAGMKRLSWANTNFCLDNELGRLQVHNVVQIWECNDFVNQQWTFNGTNGA